MQPTILLFDIDGTLIHGGGAGKRALVRAFERVYGRSDWLEFPLGGMTDLLIVRQALERGGRQGDPVEPVLERYVELLREEIPASPRYETCPGVVPLLERLSGVARRDDTAARVALGLGTGNIEAGARIKLERLDLNRYFAFGGFGSDHAERAELLRIGAARGAARLGAPLDDCRVVVIGDTPLDVAAGRAIGAECVGVATGSYDTAALEAAGADRAFADLAQDGVEAALLGR
jgi:phosphoglycolate phosphatase